MEPQEVRDFLARNSVKIAELRQDIQRKVAGSLKNDEGRKAWSDACTLFHETYDGLAFPGGLEHAMTLLQGGDNSMAEAALIYCEVRPYYFRSGYNRNKFLRLLSHVPLPTHLETRLKAVKDEVHRRKLESRRKVSEYWRERLAAAEKESKRE